MHPILTYTLGLLTLPALGLAAMLLGEIADRRDRRRYQRAWDKFSAEWDAMPLGEQVDFLANRPSYEPQYGDGKSAWFAHRWKYGHTTEV